MQSLERCNIFSGLFTRPGVRVFHGDLVCFSSYGRDALLPASSLALSFAQVQPREGGGLPPAALLGARGPAQRLHSALGLPVPPAEGDTFRVAYSWGFSAFALGDSQSVPRYLTGLRVVG